MFSTFGPELEALVGPVAFLGLYLSTGIAGWLLTWTRFVPQKLKSEGPLILTLTLIAPTLTLIAPTLTLALPLTLTLTLTLTLIP